MKKLLTGLISLFVFASVNGQLLQNQAFSEQAKSNKTASRVLLYGGGALVVGGIVSYAAESSTSYYPGKTVGTILVACGAAAITGGLILSSKSNNSQKRENANSFRLNMKWENAFVYRQRTVQDLNFPALSLNFRIK